MSSVVGYALVYGVAGRAAARGLRLARASRLCWSRTMTGSCGERVSASSHALLASRTRWACRSPSDWVIWLM